MKNDGKNSEEIFENWIASFGKRAYLHRFVDASEVKGRTGRVGTTRAAPSDYLLTMDGRTLYAEVKSCQAETSFPFSYLRVKQSATAVQVLAAGGEYDVFIHRLPDGGWYRVSYRVIMQAKANGKSSLKWKDLESYREALLG